MQSENITKRKSELSVSSKLSVMQGEQNDFNQLNHMPVISIGLLRFINVDSR